MPEADFERVAEQVNALPEVAHNYRRDAPSQHVVRARDRDARGNRRGRHDRIEARTGLPVFAFPKEREYFVELRLVA